jgi:hypothetical protein
MNKAQQIDYLVCVTALSETFQSDVTHLLDQFQHLPLLTRKCLIPVPPSVSLPNK